MKKNTNIIMVLYTVLCFTFISCSKDNEGSDVFRPTDVQSASEIQGSWKAILSGVYVTYTFTDNRWESVQTNFSGGNKTINHGTFTVSKGRITFKYEYSVEGIHTPDYSATIQWWNNEKTQLNIGKFAYHKK